MSDANYSDTTNEETNSSTTTKTEKPEFFTTLARQLIYLILMIIIGGIMLYSSKVSQTGLMPVTIYCEPFTVFSNTRTEQDVVLNIDVVKMKEGNQSTKIIFPYKSNNNIICHSFLGVSFLKSWVEGEDSNPYTRYIGTIWQSLYAYAFSLYNTFYSMLARYFTESMIVFLGPFILPYAFIFYKILHIVWRKGMVMSKCS